MSDPTTVNRSLAVPLHGADVDTWDQPLNNNFTALDTIVGGIASIATTGGITTLNAAQLACGTISVSGALVSNAILYFPSVQGWWTIENLTTGAFVLQISPAGASATQIIAVPPGELTDIQINATVAKFRNLGRVGTYMDDCGATVPAWITSCTIPPYLNCDGTTFSAITYPFLNTRLGGNILPDLRGVARYTLNQGTSRLTSAVAGIDGNTRFSLKSTATNAIQTTNLPPIIPTGTITNGAITINQNANSKNSASGVGAGGNPLPSPSPAVITASQAPSTFTGSDCGGTSTPFGTVATGTISGITMIRAA